MKLQAARELAARAIAEDLGGRDCLSSPRAVRDLLRLRLAGLPHEVFVCLQARRAAPRDCVRGAFPGNTDADERLSPRSREGRTARANAAAVIFAHNHPSGVAEPSHADEILTRSLKSALALVDVQVLDHFIVAGNAHHELCGKRTALTPGAPESPSQTRGDTSPLALPCRAVAASRLCDGLKAARKTSRTRADSQRMGSSRTRYDYSKEGEPCATSTAVPGSFSRHYWPKTPERVRRTFIAWINLLIILASSRDSNPLLPPTGGRCPRPLDDGDLKTFC